MATISPTAAFINKIPSIPASQVRKLSINSDLDLKELLSCLRTTSDLKVLNFIYHTCVLLELTNENNNCDNDFGMPPEELPRTEMALLINPHTPATMIHQVLGLLGNNKNAKLPSEWFLCQLAYDTKNLIVIDLLVNNCEAWVANDDEGSTPKASSLWVLEMLMQNPNCPSHIKYLLALEG